MLAEEGPSGGSLYQFDALTDPVQRAAMFDEVFYRDRNAERLGGAPPLRHFLLIGEAEGAHPYANYSPGKVRATLRARGAQVRGNPFLPFVQSQLDAFRKRVERNRALKRPTWVSPVGMLFGRRRARLLDAGSPPSERPALRFRIDENSGTDFVIPIVAPGDAVQRLSVSAQGGVTETPISLAISKNLAEPPLAIRAGRFQPEIIRDPLGSWRHSARKRPALFSASQRR